MKNFLKVSPEQWVKERKIGQTSFIIKRTLIFAVFLMPVCLAVNYLFISEKEDFRVGLTVLTAVVMSVFTSVDEWASLEYNHWKNREKSQSKIKLQSE